MQLNVFNPMRETLIINFTPTKKVLRYIIAEVKPKRLIILFNKEDGSVEKIQAWLIKNFSNDIAIFFEEINSKSSLDSVEKVTREILLYNELAGNETSVGLTNYNAGVTQDIRTAKNVEYDSVKELAFWEDDLRKKVVRDKPFNLVTGIEDNVIARLILAFCEPDTPTTKAFIDKSINSFMNTPYKIKDTKVRDVMKKLVIEKLLAKNEKKYTITDLGLKYKLDRVLELLKYLKFKTDTLLRTN